MTLADWIFYIGAGGALLWVAAIGVAFLFGSLRALLQPRKNQAVPE